MALRVNVTRHPFSFRGSEIPTDNTGNRLEMTWKWSDNLNIYAGDEIHQYLGSMNVHHREIELLRSPGGLQDVLNNPDKRSHRLSLQALEQISRLRGSSMAWTQSNLMNAVKNISRDQLAQARGQQVSELDVIAGDSFKQGLRNLGKAVGIQFDFDVNFRWYPLDSQRALLYAAEFGAQEALADALSRRHFTLRQASCDRATVLDAAQEVGLDPNEIECMLQGDAFQDVVRKSYSDTVGKHGIHSIPFFTFNGPDTNGGKFRNDGGNSGEHVVQGSGNVEQFLQVFERIKKEHFY